MAQEQESRGGAWRALRQKWTGRTAEKGGADAEEPARLQRRRLTRPDRTRVFTTSNQGAASARRRRRSTWPRPSPARACG